MRRKQVKVTLSPNEEGQLIREEQERRRILRIQQVREQQRNIAQHVREKVERRRQQELDLLAKELRAQWEQQQKQRVDHLQRLFQENLTALGQGHRNAKENEPDPRATDLKVESDNKAAERYHKALKELKRQQQKNQENQSRSVDARRKALEVEKIRAAKMASLPLPSVQPLQDAVSKAQHVVKKCDAHSFAATHYHMPETLVDKETISKPSASVEAEQEVQRITLVQRREEQTREERLEKARLRGREALRREQLFQDHGRLLLELEHMQQTDLRRRRQQVECMPRQIFEPLYRRRDSQLNLQRDMEFAFEDMYSGERRVKGDLLYHLVPEPLPPPSTDSLCQDLDISQNQLTTTEQDSAQQDQQMPTDQDQAEQEGIITDADSPNPKVSDEGNAVRPRQGLKKLLTRIQTQRQRWSESEALSTNSPCEQDSSIDTGCLSTADKLCKSDVEHSNTVAEKIQEIEEQKRKEEILEREKLKQTQMLEQLNSQRLKLEEKLCEAQKQRALQKTPATPHGSHNTQESVAGSSSMIMEEDRCRLLKQNEIHQTSVKVARQRLEEYQRAIRLRQKTQTVPPATLFSALQSSAVPLPVVTPSAIPAATVQPMDAACLVVPPPAFPTAAFLPSDFPSSVPSAFRPSAVPTSTFPPSTLLPATVAPPTSLAPTAVLPATVQQPLIIRPPFLSPSFIKSSVPSSLPTAFQPFNVPVPAVPPPAAVPLPSVTHSADPLHRPEIPNAVPTETVTRNMVPIRPPFTDFGSDSFTVLRRKAFLKFLQDRLGVTQCDAQTKQSGQPFSQSSPSVSMLTGPSVVGTTSGLHRAMIGPSAPVSTSLSQVVTYPSPSVSMVLGSNVPDLPTSTVVASGQVGTTSCLVSDRVEVEKETVCPDLGGLRRERPEFSHNLKLTSQTPQEEDVPPMDNQQTRSELLQTLLRALEHSNIRTSQHEDSELPSFSGSSGASSGCSSVLSIPSSAAPKPPVSRTRLGCVDSALHQLSVIEEVNTSVSVILLTVEDAITADDIHESKQTDSLSGTLSDFAQHMDSPQSLDFGSRANSSESSVPSSYKHAAQPDSRAQPSLSSTISTGSYITTDPELQSQPESERVPVETPPGSSQAQQSQPEEEVLDQRTRLQTPEFSLVETVEAVPAGEPSVLENEASFRPLLAQIYDQSMGQDAEDVTSGLENMMPHAEDLKPGLGLLLGHPSAHSSMIVHMPGALDSTVSGWRVEHSIAPFEMWQSKEQQYVPIEHSVKGPEYESSADASTCSGFHQLHAEVMHSQMETTDPLVQAVTVEPCSPEQMREDEPWSHVHGLVDGLGILEQSLITLVSLTDSSSDEQEPEEEEKAGAHGHEEWTPVLSEITCVDGHVHTS